MPLKETKKKGTFKKKKGLGSVMKKSWRQHSPKQQLYGHLPPIMKTIKIRRTRHARPCWRSRDELISDVFRWTPSHGRAKAGRPSLTYIQQLSTDTGCSPGDLPEVMDDRERWRERVRDTRADSVTWWWWWWWMLIKHVVEQKLKFSELEITIN